MTSLILAALFFVGIHLLVAGTTLRDRLIARLGAGPYRGLFALAARAARWCRARRERPEARGGARVGLGGLRRRAPEPALPGDRPVEGPAPPGRAQALAVAGGGRGVRPAGRPAPAGVRRFAVAVL